MEEIHPLSIVGLIGLGGIVAMIRPVEKAREGGFIRALGLIGLGGFIGIWVPPVGAMGAAGALGLWNHQNRKLAFWGALGWAWVLGLAALAHWYFG